VGGNIFSDGFFAFAAVVHIRRIDEGDARSLRGFQNFEGFLFIEGITPSGTQLPGAQTDFADRTARFAKYALLHSVCPPSVCPYA